MNFLTPKTAATRALVPRVEMKEVVDLPVLALFEDVLRIVQEGSEEYNDHSPALSYPKSRVSFQLRQLAEDD